jgi:hypothetical protein
MKATFVKTNIGLHPCGDDAKELYEKVGEGELVLVEYQKTRNYQNHRRIFAFFRTTFEMQDKFDNFEIWRKALLISAGHYEPVITPEPEEKARLFSYLETYLGGKRKAEVIEAIHNAFKLQLVPKSIAFSEMDEVEFGKLFSDLIDAFIKFYGNGVTTEELNEVLAFV